MIPYFIRENVVRKYLQALYVSLAIGPKINAESFLYKDFDRLKIDEGQGNVLVKQCFAAVIRWLGRLYEACASPQIFFGQFFNPVKQLSNFVLSVRKMQKRTTQLTGWLIGRSEPFFDRYFKQKVSVLTFLIPELETAVSLHYPLKDPQGLKDMEGALCIIDGIQPFPFVNRLHPASAWHFSCADHVKLNLDQADFLKLSLYDVDFITKSLAFENFCEIATEQFQGRHKLGCVCILGGRAIIEKGFHHIILESTIKPECRIRLRLSNRLFKISEIHNPAELERYDGKTVRVLAILWFNWDHPYLKRILDNEVVAIEPVEDEKESIKDDLTGFIRIRRKVHFSEIMEKYPKNELEQLFTDSLKISGDSIQYQERKLNTDPVLSLFRRTLTNIKLQRTTENVDIFLRPQYIFDTKLMKVQGIVERMKKKPAEVEKLLLMLVYKAEKEGVSDEGFMLCTYDTTFKEFIRKISEEMGLPEGYIEDAYYWLKYYGLIRCAWRAKKGIKITNLALDALKARFFPLVKKELEGKSIINIVELKKKLGIPLICILQILRELEKRRVLFSSRVNGEKCELLWSVNADFQVSPKDLQAYEKQVLKALQKFPHPIHVSVISKETGNILDCSLLSEIILPYLETKGLIVRNGKQMWFYPIDKRIEKILAENPTTSFTAEQIADMTNSPVHDALIVLRNFERKNLVIRIAQDRWVYRPYLEKNPEKARDFIINEGIRFLTGKIEKIQKKSGQRYRNYQLELIRTQTMKYLFELIHHLRKSCNINVRGGVNDFYRVIENEILASQN